MLKRLKYIHVFTLYLVKTLILNKGCMREYGQSVFNIAIPTFAFLKKLNAGVTGTAFSV